MRTVLVSFAFLVLGSGAASACPDWSLSGEEFALTGEELYRQQSFPVTAGGETNIQGCGNVDLGDDGGSGFVTEQPDFTFDFTGLADYRLVMMLESECDNILLVNTATKGWRYDDDGAGGLNGRVDIRKPADGLYDVWVGTLDGDYCEAVLTVETFEK